MILSRDDISLIHTYLLGNIPLHPSLQKAYTLTQTSVLAPYDLHLITYTLMRTSAKLLYRLLKIDSTILQVTNPDV